MTLQLGDLSVIAGLLVIVGGLQWRAMKATIRATEDRLSARLDVLEAKLDGIATRLSLVEQDVRARPAPADHS